MPVFEEVRFSWEGKEHVIPPERILRAIAEVEEVLTLAQLSAYVGKRDLPLAKLSQAFGILLRAAGVDVSDDAVYDSMFEGEGREMQRRAIAAVTNLHKLMIPPKHWFQSGKSPAAPAKQGTQRAAPSNSSTDSASGKTG